MKVDKIGLTVVTLLNSFFVKGIREISTSDNNLYIKLELKRFPSDNELNKTIGTIKELCGGEFVYYFDDEPGVGKYLIWKSNFRDRQSIISGSVYYKLAMKAIFMAHCIAVAILGKSLLWGLGVSCIIFWALNTECEMLNTLNAKKKKFYKYLFSLSSLFFPALFLSTVFI